MKSIFTDQPIRWWSEILPLTFIAAVLFYLMITWNSLASLVMIVPFIAAAYFFGAPHLWWIIVGLVPLSINTELFMESSVSFYLPTEPLLFGFLVLSLLYFIKHPVDRRFINHPISRLAFLYFGWLLITIFTSTDPLVSLKSFTAHMWFLVPIFYLGSKMLTKKKSRSRFLNVYLIGFTVVVFYTLFRLWSHGFPEKESQWLMQPFFKDHTILGAVLGLVIPYVYLRCFSRSLNPVYRTLWTGLALVFTGVLIFTYSRAALLSLAVAGMMYLIILMRIRFRYLLIAGVFLAGIAFLYQNVLMERLSSNQAESSGEVVQNIESISNVTTDASNLERINRWNAAIEMWKERPFFGWGPGTYQFVYAPFQKSADLTIISTNEGDVGNAHSEFLGTLAESGLPAFILLGLLVLTMIGTAYHRVLRFEGNDRMVLLAVLLGLVAYFTHGVLNNFLNSDKVSVLIWGFAAIIIHYDLEDER